MEEKDKKENRGYIVWSIAIGAILGFLINIFANLYYDIFIKNNLTWEKINHSQFIICILVFIAVIGYIQFFITDYPNTFEFSKKYWKRYQSYFFNKYLPGIFLYKLYRFFFGLYLIIFLILIIVFLYILSVKLWGIPWGIIIFILLMFLTVIREKYRRK